MSSDVKALNPVQAVYCQSVVTARGQANTWFSVGPKYKLEQVELGVLVTFTGSEAKVLVPWANVSNVVYAAPEVVKTISGVRAVQGRQGI